LAKILFLLLPLLQKIDNKLYSVFANDTGIILLVLSVQRVLSSGMRRACVLLIEQLKMNAEPLQLQVDAVVFDPMVAWE